MKLLNGFESKDRLLIKAAIVVLILLGSLGFLYHRNQTLKGTLARTEANYKAAKDSLRVTTAKDGSIEYDKLSFIVKDLAELKKYNQDLARELAITKGKVLTIQNIGTKVVHDTISMEVEKPVIKDGVVLINGFYDTAYTAGNYRLLKTETKYNLKDSTATQKVTQDEIGFTATTGIKSTEKGYEIFLRPHYPGMSVTRLDGAIVEKNFFKAKSKIPLVTVGASVGFQPFGFDVMYEKFLFTPSRIGLTLGLNFNINKK